ncbi:MAG TPA: type II toxin-antitoxin system VapC family toxin [Micropepsaceae bacterium]|nr:type II toxin-antitoxin system VapC family toxin [Micropepsaceae bacterium]
MSQRFLLDTNIISDLVRNPQGRVAAQIALHDADAFSTSIIVASELRYGAARKGSRRLTAQIEAILEAIEIHPIERPFDRIYGSLRSQMESTGALIGGNDLLIAAHALQTGRTLVTANEREFMRVPGLKLVNWLA